jgi:TfoX/Sxy family transcriptional regulator of competence genes
MMGGLTFMVNGKMCVGILKEDLMARIDPEVHEDALKRKGCREMDFTGRPMKGFVFVGPEGTSTGRDLGSLVRLALAFNKEARRSKRRKRKSS